MERCSECGNETEAHNLRPYGKDLAPICFWCGEKSPERTKANMRVAFERAAADGGAVLTDEGIVSVNDLARAGIIQKGGQS